MPQPKPARRRAAPLSAPAALQVLKQKRLYEGQRETLYAQQFNMEQTRFTVESIQDTAQTVSALKAASSQMRGAMRNKELDINFIDSLQVRRRCAGGQGGAGGSHGRRALHGA